MKLIALSRNAPVGDHTVRMIAPRAGPMTRPMLNCAVLSDRALIISPGGTRSGRNDTPAGALNV